MKRPKMVTAVLTVAVLVVLAIAGGLGVMYSGLVDVAASKPEGPVASWVLDTTMVHSVRRHAAGFAPDLSRADLNKGAADYSGACAMCHGGPGDEPASDIGKGLNPPPPDLREAAGDWSAGEIYWIVEHGIKMTGMPSFGKTLQPDQLRNITELIVKMPTATSQASGASRP